jgi:D-cysteine desulfhydrase
MEERELFKLIPDARGRIPWLPLARLPTPLMQVPLQMGGDVVQQWVKRDDLSGETYGGNKVRKLEFLLADAERKGSTRIVTAGAFGSHHALATTVYARKLGMEVTVVLFPQRITPHVRQILFMLKGLGADIRFTRRMEFVPVSLARVRRSFGSSAYVIKPGGSDGLGTLGYVECGLELARQWSDGIAPRPQRIHVAAGTLGTVAGLALGLAMAGAATDIMATRITSSLVTNERALMQLLRDASALLDAGGGTLPDVNDVAQRVTFVHDQIGEGYGRPTPAGERAADKFAAAGMVLDATYTAKAAAALLADPLTRDGDTLFMNTLSANAPIESAEHVRATDLPHQIAARIKDL